MHTKHTPGPWACPHGARIYGADSHLVAETAFEHRGTTETEANAALMAAAPDLLALAYDFGQMLTGMDPYSVDDVAIMRNKIKAAIARATGAAQ